MAPIMASRSPSQILCSQLLPSYQRLRLQLRALRLQLESFEDKDRLAWHAWMTRHFQDPLRQIDALQEELTQLAVRLHAANQLALSGEFPSRKAAYEEVLRQEHDDPQRLDPASLPASNRLPSAEPDLLLESILHQLCLEARACLPVLSTPAGPGTVGAPCPSAKQLFRSLAKRLHPGLNPQAGPLEMELWTEVQRAYQARDVRTLETIELRHRLDSGQPPNPEDQEILRDLVLAWTEVRDTLRNELRTARKAPAWGFSSQSPGARKRFTETTRQALKAQLATLRRELQDLRREEEKLAANPAPRSIRANRPNRQTSRDPEEIGMPS